MATITTRLAGSMDIHSAAHQLMCASTEIQKNAGYACGVEYLRLSEDKMMYSGFFLSPDYQNDELYCALKMLPGWQSAGYAAAYHWKVRNGNIYISYTEGDLSIYELAITKEGHGLHIRSLNDAQAFCLCGDWHYSFTGERTKWQIIHEYNKHIKRHEDS